MKDIFTVGLAVEAIEALVTLTPEQQFRISAIIKRLVHHEKADLLERLQSYCEHTPEMGIRTIGEKLITHNNMKDLPDEEIITWSVPSLSVARQPN